MASVDINEREYDVLHRFSESGVWTVHTHFQFQGTTIDAGGRCIIYHIPHKHALAVVNPCKLTSSVIESIKSLEVETNAKVLYILSPAEWHYLFAGEFKSNWPDAVVYLSPGRPQKQSLTYSYELYDMSLSNPLPELLPTLEVYNFRGMCGMNDQQTSRPELLFYHTPSRSLAAGDALMCRMPIEGFNNNWLTFHFAQWKVIRNASAVRASLRHAVEWKPVAYICVHGELGNFIVGEEEIKKNLEDEIKFYEKTPEGWVDIQE